MASMIVNWKTLMEVPRWTPVAEIGHEVHLLKSPLYKVTETCYITAVDHTMTGQTSGAPYYAMLIWAESDAAALQAVEPFKVDHFLPSSKGSPPDELIARSEEGLCTKH